MVNSQNVIEDTNVWKTLSTSPSYLLKFVAKYYGDFEISQLILFSRLLPLNCAQLEKIPDVPLGVEVI